jgi:nucleotide-binding universal stress UspA family protein
MRVFLATDGSPSSLAAQQLLAEFPFPERPEVTIATVCPAADLTSIGAAVTAPVTEMLEKCRREADQLLRDYESRCAPWARSVNRLLLDGHPADELLKAIDRQKPDLVVVGARGLGAVRRVLLGSVSERLVKHAPCSVLVAHPPQGRTAVKSIVLSYDGSPAAAGALNRLASLPLGQREVHLVSVVETVHVYGTEMLLEGSGGIEGERANHQARLQQAATKLAGGVAKVTSEVHSSADVAADILGTAEKWGAELIVLGSRGKSAWERFLLGSTTLRVLHQAPCSVWIEKVPA